LSRYGEFRPADYDLNHSLHTLVRRPIPRFIVPEFSVSGAVAENGVDKPGKRKKKIHGVF
jgi:hypothetical protein